MSLYFKWSLKSNKKTSVNDFKNARHRFVQQTMIISNMLFFKIFWHMNVEIYYFTLNWSFSGETGFCVSIETALKTIISWIDSTIINYFWDIMHFYNKQTLILKRQEKLYLKVWITLSKKKAYKLTISWFNKWWKLQV